MVITARSYRLPIQGILLAALLGGCAVVPEPAEELDPRIDQLIAKVDRSLDRQAVVDEQLQAQSQQLKLQQEQLESMSQDLGFALKTPDQRNCPKVAACPERGEDESKMVVGALEEIWLSALEVPVKARIDTGVQTSSLNARNIESFERDGKPWVRFEIVDPRTDEPVQVERKLRRTIGFVQNEGSEPKRRPVVRMGIVIGDIREKAEFTLVERKREEYQALIGRSVLNDVMVVDVSRENIAPYVLPDDSEDGTGTTQ